MFSVERSVLDVQLPQLWRLSRFADVATFVK